MYFTAIVPKQIYGRRTKNPNLHGEIRILVESDSEPQARKKIAYSFGQGKCPIGTFLRKFNYGRDSLLIHSKVL
jgi:hypothetical protein